jgi:hypothetical protein
LENVSNRAEYNVIVRVKGCEDALHYEALRAKGTGKVALYFAKLWACAELARNVRASSRRF